MVCAQTATNLIEPKMWPLLWMEWQEILHEVGHPHLVRTIRGWPGSASGTERSHVIHGSTDGTPWPCHPWIHGWHAMAMPDADPMPSVDGPCHPRMAWTRVWHRTDNVQEALHFLKEMPYCMLWKPLLVFPRLFAASTLTLACLVLTDVDR